MNLKEKLEDYTEEAFISYLSGFFDNPMGIKATGPEIYLDNLVEHFDRIVLHPEGNGFFIYLMEEIIH
ncbi:bacteriocin immunity protein [Pectobacterium actinidiae]|nr:bacteriocin immunity protein [Pectobacterium actinidiae]KHN90664.1 hypothetical protein KKH3_06910 [Pectobacterium actinidiae]WEF12974.1 bacteriocin immunity protein [Pectobacterium actinidiae]